MLFSGKRFRIARIEANLRQKEFAKILGVSANFVSLIENEKKQPSMQLLSKAALSLNKDMNWFFQTDNETLGVIDETVSGSQNS